MKVNEIIIQENEQLDEIKLKHVLAGAALGAAIGAGGVVHHHDKTHATHAPTHATHASAEKKEVKKTAAQEETERVEKLTKIVLDKYKNNLKELEAEKIVQIAIKHETPVFKAEDALALIGVESSFDKNAKSNLKKDKAIGLTQIRPGVWGMRPSDLKGNIEKQIKTTYEILDKYHKKIGGSKDDAFHAYNVGITNFRHGKGLNPDYPKKIKKELTRYM